MENFGVSNQKSVELTLTKQVAEIKQKPKERSSAAGSPQDKVNVGMGEVYKSLTVLADKIIGKLDELLAEELPEGIRSLRPEDHTAEATSQRIVDGVTALMPIFARQNPGLEGEELISEFMTTIRGGISQGYNEAAAILGDLGAFEIDGVQSGIEETMSLVEEKLLAFETEYRKSNGLLTEEPSSSEGNPEKAENPAS